MYIGLVDVDSHKFPNLALMKLSAWHKSRGDSVEFADPLCHYDRIYVSKIFGDEYSSLPPYSYDADEIIYGGTGFAIKIENGKEVYHKYLDDSLPYDIEHIYPDYSLYPELTKETCFGFLSRGCCNDCSFCIVSKKEGRCSVKVADLSEFWRGQKYIKLLDPNILACKDRIELLEQLRDSKAKVDFTQGLDARFVTEEVALLLKQIKKATVHFAFDFMDNEKAILKGLKIYRNIVGLKRDVSSRTVYVLTNYNTSHFEDIYRIKKLEELGYAPDVRIYRKHSAPQITRDLQRWANNRILYNSTKWEDYVPRADGRTIREIYY